MSKFEQKSALVCGAGGFIGSHVVERLKFEGFWVRGIDLKYPMFSETLADDFALGDLSDPNVCRAVVDFGFEEVYQQVTRFSKNFLDQIAATDLQQ